ncbi:MAG TPA: DUF1488 family protein [Burkholderiaceae bacterium]|jgi:hypothetical protein|nr:DUF1488 family protein [Burkholderiaceae bacterium]
MQSRPFVELNTQRVWFDFPFHGRKVRAWIGCAVLRERFGRGAGTGFQDSLMTFMRHEPEIEAAAREAYQGQEPVGLGASAFDGRPGDDPARDAAG